MRNIKRSFGTICDGDIEVLLLTEEDLDGALDVITNSFQRKESVCIGTEINLPGSDQAREDLLELCREVFTDGVSLIAKDINTGEVVAVAFNKVQIEAGPTDEPYFADFIKRRRCTAESASLINFMIEVDKQYDLFGNLEIDCLLEMMFLATLTEYEGRKIAQSVCKYSIEFAKELGQGIGLKCIREDLRDKRIKAVSAILTSRISQSIGRGLNMKTFIQIPYTGFSFNGKTYAERIGPNNPTANLVVLKL